MLTAFRSKMIIHKSDEFCKRLGEYCCHFFGKNCVVWDRPDVLNILKRNRPSNRSIGFCENHIIPPWEVYYKLSSSFIHTAKDASDGILKSPRGESVTVPTFGPSGIHERLNC